MMQLAVILSEAERNRKIPSWNLHAAPRDPSTVLEMT
jgi:hypothetical protein